MNDNYAAPRDDDRFVSAARDQNFLDLDSSDA